MKIQNYIPKDISLALKQEKKCLGLITTVHSPFFITKGNFDFIINNFQETIDELKENISIDLSLILDFYIISNLGIFWFQLSEMKGYITIENLLHVLGKEQNVLTRNYKKEVLEFIKDFPWYQNYSIKKILNF